jgi:hypothetical protein
MRSWAKRESPTSLNGDQRTRAIEKSPPALSGDWLITLKATYAKKNNA